jgi:hypothetical protein
MKTEILIRRFWLGGGAAELRVQVLRRADLRGEAVPAVLQLSDPVVHGPAQERADRAGKNAH